MSNLDATTITNNVFVLNSFVLPAGTFPVLFGSENPLAEQAVFFWLECTVVDGFCKQFDQSPRQIV